MPKQKLEIVVSRHALDELPNDIVKIVLSDSGMTIDPKKRMYMYGADSVLDIKDVQIKIAPKEDTIYIGKETFYISGLVHLMINNANEIQRQSYVNVQKFMEKRRQQLEKEHFKKQHQAWAKEEEYKKRDRY